MNDGEELDIENPAYFPDPSTIEHCEEPFIKASILMPERYIGAVMTLCLDRRGENPQYITPPLAGWSLPSSFPWPRLSTISTTSSKTVTQGYGSFDYELLDYRTSDLVKLDILVNGEKVDALSSLVHRDRARTRALHAVNKLKESIPRQQFKVAIQGAIGSTIVARSNVNAYRKDVTAKCYGGDVSRKRKLLESKRRVKSA